MARCSERRSTGGGPHARDGRWTLALASLFVALLPAIGRAEPQSVTATIHSITVDGVGNASYSLLIDSTIVEAEKQGVPCDGFAPDDEVSASWDDSTIVLISGEKTCRLIVRRLR